MNRPVYTILFMTLITALFISALAVLNERAQPRIMNHREMEEMRSVLYAFGMLPGGVEESGLPPAATIGDLPWKDTEIQEDYQNHLRKYRVKIPDSLKQRFHENDWAKRDSVEIFVRVNDSENPVAYGFPVDGMGLWGTLSAFAAVSSDLKNMAGIDFTAQVETPGLGARITEQEFKYFFRSLDLSRFEYAQADQPGVVMVRNKVQTNVEMQTHELQAITGATQTCDGVLEMINTDLAFYLALLRDMKRSEEKLKNNALSLSEESG